MIVKVMTGKDKNTVRKGFTLLLTLLTLVILAVIIVQFQADTFLTVKASGYRLQSQQCRYAAESGIIVAIHQVKEILQQMAETGQATSESNTAEPNLPAQTDSNQPNQTADLNQQTEEEQTDTFPAVSGEPSFIIKKSTIQIGDIKVDIEIHDENGKWPLLWLLRSPYDPSGNNSKVKAGLPDMATRLSANQSLLNNIIDIAMEIGQPLELPPPENELYQVKMYSPGGRTRASSASNTVFRVKVRKADRIKETQQRYRAMGVFATRWYSEFLRDQEDYIPKWSGAVQQASFMDYLGWWGHNRINLNTAPYEVLWAAFSPLGIDKQTIDEIVQYRRKSPFKSLGELRNIRKIDTNTRRAMINLSTVNSDTFSVYVKADMGRAHYSLIGGINKGLKSRFTYHAVFPGE